MRLVRFVYPTLVGLLLGLLQTGLYFQLSFTLSSSYTTFLLVTICWLVGNLFGLFFARRLRFPLNGFLLLALLAYFACAILLNAAPFDTHLWLAYVGLIVVIGLYPGVFFTRLAQRYSARQLFLRENNGFILGLITGTVTFLLWGRIALWSEPILLTILIISCTQRPSIQSAAPNALAKTQPEQG